MATKKKSPVSRIKTESTVRASTSSRKKITKSKAPILDESEVLESRPLTAPKMAFKIRKLYVIIVLALIAAGLLLYAGRGLFVVALINGQPLTRVGVAAELEKMYGTQAMDFLIVKNLVEQEAEKKRVSVTDEEVEKELKKNEEILKANQQTLEQFLQFRGINMYQYTEGLRLQLLAKKILGEVKVTDKQITDYIAQNEERFTTIENDAEKKKIAKEELVSNEMGSKINEWVSKVRADAKVTTIHEYK